MTTAPTNEQQLTHLKFKMSKGLLLHGSDAWHLMKEVERLENESEFKCKHPACPRIGKDIREDNTGGSEEAGVREGYDIGTEPSSRKSKTMGRKSKKKTTINKEKPDG